MRDWILFGVGAVLSGLIAGPWGVVACVGSPPTSSNTTEVLSASELYPERAPDVADTDADVVLNQARYEARATRAEAEAMIRDLRIAHPSVVSNPD